MEDIDEIVEWAKWIVEKFRLTVSYLISLSESCPFKKSKGVRLNIDYEH